MLLKRWPLFLVTAVALLLWAPRLHGPLDLRYDSGVYLLLGVSLAEGHGYRISSEPGTPEAVQYPPLLPAFVALHAKLFHTTDSIQLGTWLRRSYFILFLCFAIAVLTLARTQLSPALATLASVLCLLQLNTYLISDLLFSELPYALLSVLFVLVLIRRATRLSGAVREALAFLLAAGGFLLRSAGIVLLVAWVAEAVLHRHWKLAAFRGVLALLPVVLWQAHVHRVQSSSEYRHPAYTYQRAAYQFYNVTYADNMRLTDPFRPELGQVDASILSQRFLANLKVIPTSLGEAASTTYGFWRWGLNELQDKLLHRRPIPEGIVLPPLWLLSACVFAGLLVMACRGDWLIGLVVLGSIFLVCTTPWPGQFSRYLTPLIPFLTLGLVVFVRWIHEAAPSRFEQLHRLALAGGLSLISLTLLAQGFTAHHVFARRENDPPMQIAPTSPAQHVFYHDSHWQNWEKAIDWIRDHTPSQSIVATNLPQLCYLATGRKAVFPPMEANAEAARKLLDAVPVSYLIVDELEFLDISRRYGEPAVTGVEPKWRPVFDVGQTRVFERVSAIE
ncbi:MAG TPA: hypothetical protein VFT72_20515 [Opitutaceae bacterium]|nr:hypothetical protein [Opitutaceae bacterium]